MSTKNISAPLRLQEGLGRGSSNSRYFTRGDRLCHSFVRDNQSIWKNFDSFGSELQCFMSGSRLCAIKDGKPVICLRLNQSRQSAMSMSRKRYFRLILMPTIKNMYIPLVTKDVQLLIAEKMQNGKDAKSKSKQLLEIAKTGVERAIATDEATATAWMNQQLEALGINLSNSN
ncbi:hypothetical protein [Nostoc sp. DSM 114167]|uniref:hypothetical protein n=1 Tax=Nostoc sp. DSM 114167 TaxID=3439050 RepID=UPI0040463C9C